MVRNGRHDSRVLGGACVETFLTERRLGSFAFWRRGGEIPGLKPSPGRGAVYAGLKPACGRQVQLPLLKQGAPAEKRLQVIPKRPHERGMRRRGYPTRVVMAVSLWEGLVESGQF